MSRKIFITIIASVLIILLPACNLPGGTPVANATNPAPTAASADIQTQVAGMVAATEAAAALANNAAQTLTAMPTATPQFTFTPSFTPTATSTLTPSISMVSVSVNTNCRSGPGDPYDILSILVVGKTAQAVGRAADNGFWIIQNPANPASTCWLWSQYATVTGNSQGLPVITPPPSPTPSPTPPPSFNVSYVEMETCTGQYGFTFKITNTGSLTWESVKIVVTDTVTSTVTTHTRDSFKSYSGCTASSEAQNLDPGDVGETTTVEPGQFTYNPTGHEMKAVVTVYSQNGLAGTSLSKTLTFTP